MEENNMNRMKLREFIRLEVDIDIYNDVTDDDPAVAMVGPIRLSHDAEEYFAEILNLDVDVHDDYAVVCVDDELDKVWKSRLRKVNELFRSAAGYCSEETYERWFE